MKTSNWLHKVQENRYTIFEIRLNVSHIISESGIYCSVLKRKEMLTRMQRPFDCLFLRVSSHLNTINWLETYKTNNRKAVSYELVHAGMIESEHRPVWQLGADTLSTSGSMWIHFCTPEFIFNLTHSTTMGCTKSSKL